LAAVQTFQFVDAGKAGIMKLFIMGRNDGDDPVD
jgi:hypothetical protein